MAYSPEFPLVKASQAVTCSSLGGPPIPTEFLDCSWSPSGPASDSIRYQFYSSDPAELDAMCVGLASSCVPQVDLSDIPITGDRLSPAGGCTSNCAINDPRFWVTYPNPMNGMFEIDFNHANTFWGIPFNFGRDGQTCPNPLTGVSFDCTAAAVNIRQGIASLVDKVAFVAADAGSIGPNAFPMDNPTSPASKVMHSGYPYDETNPNATTIGCVQTGTADFTNCNDTGHYAVTPGDAGSLSRRSGQQAVAVGTPGSIQLGGVCSWDRVKGCGSPAISAFHYANDATDSNGFVLPGTPDFCNAASHFIAAGLATGTNSQCELTGEAASLSGRSIIIFRRSSLGRSLLAYGLGQAICELVDLGAMGCPQVTLASCPPLAGDCIPPTGPPTGTTSTGPNLGWHIYTGGFFLPPIPNTGYSLYTSQFASDFCGGPPNQNAANYVYFCNTSFDIWANMSEFLPTSTAAVAALQVAMDIFGNHTATIPMWSPALQFPILQGWTGVSNAAGIGTTQGNPWSLLNAWNPNPAVPGPRIRWGQRDGTTTLNPFMYSSSVESDVIQEVYDTLLTANPYSPNQLFGWMVNFYQKLDPGTAQCPASYTNSRGTFTVGACVKMISRGDIPWHDILNCPSSDSVCLTSHVVTASDVKFSFAAFNATGGLVGPSTGNTIDVLYNVNQLPSSAYGSVGGEQGSGVGETFTILLHNNNAWLLNDLVSIPIIPQHLWVDQTAPRQANGVFVPCTDLGTISCSLDSLRESSDPIMNDLLIGSGPFVCASGPLGAPSTVVGGGCAFDGSGNPIGQTIPAGGSLTLRRFGSGLNFPYAYFRTNGKFKQFQWAAYTNGVKATTADLISAIGCMNGSQPSSSPACQHWSSAASGLSCVSSAGPCIGSVGGGSGKVNTGVLVQIGQWIGRGGWNFGVSYQALYGAQPPPQTLYEDGSQESSPPPPP